MTHGTDLASLAAFAKTQHCAASKRRRDATTRDPEEACGHSFTILSGNVVGCPIHGIRSSLEELARRQVRTTAAEQFPGRWRYEASTRTVRSVPGNHRLATLDSSDGVRKDLERDVQAARRKARLPA